MNVHNIWHKQQNPFFLNCTHSNVYHKLVAYYHGHCPSTYLARFLIRVILWQWDHKMLEWTRKWVAVRRERDVRDGRRGIRREKRRRCLSTWMECDQVSYKFLHVCLWVILYDNVHMYHSNSQLTDWVNGPVHVGKEDKWLKQHYYVTSSQKLYWWMSTIYQY